MVTQTLVGPSIATAITQSMPTPAILLEQDYPRSMLYTTRPRLHRQCRGQHGNGPSGHRTPDTNHLDASYVKETHGCRQLRLWLRCAVSGLML